MPGLEIPLFVKNMGHEIIGFILNLSDKESKSIIDGSLAPNEIQHQILVEYINICRQLRIQAIDLGDVDFALFNFLPHLLQNNRHVFNLRHEQMGGQRVEIDEPDKVVYLLSKLALEIYPLFLIRATPSSRMFKQTSVYLMPILSRLPDHNLLLKEIQSDMSLSKMFSKIDASEIETIIQFSASTGRGSRLELNRIPAGMITNAYELMRLRGEFSKTALISAIKEVTEILRSAAEGKLVQVPVFLGFHNVGLKKDTIIETAWGFIRSYHEGFLDLIPPEAKPQLGGEHQILGFVFESRYPYKVKFNINDIGDWPSELTQARGNLEKLQEDLSLAIALSIERDPPVGITPSWTLVVDPISPETSISWRNHPMSPMPPYLCNEEDYSVIKNWCTTINKTEDRKIRIAIRRVLSSINEKINPIDGFVDSVIAWENLFGGKPETAFRISMSIARLLETTIEKKLELQKRINNYYNDRSKIVHGDKEITYEEAVEKRNECLKITLKCLRELYQKRSELLSYAAADRSKRLLLQ